MLLGVLSTYGSAEIIPYEPDMYNDSAGKRYGIHCLQARIKPYSPGCIITSRQWILHLFREISQTDADSSSLRITTVRILMSIPHASHSKEAAAGYSCA